MKAISTATAPAALGPYSQAIDAGAFVFVSGQVPVNPATGQIPLGAAAQAEQAFSNVRAILEAAGLGMDAVVKTTVFLSDLADFPTVRDFGDAFDLSAEDRAFVEMRLSVAREVDRLGEEQGVSQRELARRMGTKQRPFRA